MLSLLCQSQRLLPIPMDANVMDYFPGQIDLLPLVSLSPLPAAAAPINQRAGLRNRDEENTAPLGLGPDILFQNRISYATLQTPAPAS